MIKVSNKQFVWLDCRGGRTEDDVKEDKEGMYIEMYGEDGKQRKVYLPDDKKIIVHHVGRYKVAELLK